MYDLHYMN